MKRITEKILLIFSLLMLSMPLAANAAYHQTGTYGADVSWGYDRLFGALDIWGTGEMKSCDLSNIDEFTGRWGGNYENIKKVSVGEGITSIGDAAFASCESLRTVSLPTTLKKIGAYSFAMSGVQTIDIPEGTEEIDESAFMFSSLTDITIPPTLKKIGPSAFTASSESLNIRISDITSWCAIKNESGNIPVSSVNLYINDEKATSVTIPDNVESIGSYAFCNFTGLKDIKVPDSVTYIAKNAFNDYTTLLVYRNSVAHIYAEENSIPYELLAYPDTTGNEMTIANPSIKDHMLSFTAELFSPSGEIHGAIITAVYDDTGRLTGIRSYDAQESRDIILTDYSDGSVIRAFWWLSKNSVYPMADCAAINVNEVKEQYSITTEYDRNAASVILTNDGKSVIDARAGSEIAIEITPERGYQVQSVRVTDANGREVTVKDNTFIMPESNVTIKITFIMTIHKITAEYDPNGGSVEITDGKNVIAEGEEGNRITINITTNFDYRMEYLEVIDARGEAVEVNDNTFIMPSSAVTVRVAFVRVIGSGSGGVSGDNIEWILYSNGTLVISGHGAMKDYTLHGAPWYENASDIKIVVIEDGITRISQNAFADCTEIKRVLISKSVIEIEDAAFKNCTGLSTVEYGGSRSDWENIYIGIENDALLNAGFIYNSPLTDRNMTNLDYLSYRINDNDTVTITGCSGDVKNLIIPKEILGLPVTGIAESAFSNNRALESITIPESVASIGKSAFYNTSLKDAYIFDLAAWCAISFGDASANPMCYADNLYLNGAPVTEIAIPDGVTSVGDYAFCGCGNIISVTIPDGMTRIGKDAFDGCAGLKGVYASDLKNWCAINFGSSKANPLYYTNKFYLNNKQLSDRLEIPDGVPGIGDFAFSNCSGISSVIIPDSVTRIGASAFDNCANLDSVYVSDITSYLNIDFGSGASNPMYYANKLYINNRRVTVLDIPDGITRIPAYAFNGCGSLTSVTIPESVTHIDRGAFNNCTALSMVYYKGSYDDFIKIVIGIENNSLTNCTIQCNDGEQNISSYGSCGDNVSYMLDENGTLTIIGEGDMSDFTSTSAPWYGDRAKIKSVVIKNGVTSIGDNAFNGCGSITNITMPESVAKVGDSAFNGCNALGDTYYSGSLADFVKTQIGRNNARLTSSTIHCSDGDYNIVSYGFCGDDVMYILDAAGKLTIFGNGPMSDFTSTSVPWYGDRAKITSVVIRNGVTSIGNNAFGNCNGITNVTIPESIVVIADYAFNGCNALRDVYYSGTLADFDKINVGNYNTKFTGAILHCSDYDFNIITHGSCGDNAMYILDDTGKFVVTGKGDMTNYESNSSKPWNSYIGQIKSVTIENGITSIGNSAFSNCDILTSVAISDSVKSIGQNAFFHCDTLTGITMPGGVTSIGDNAFSYCIALKDITIPDSVRSIGDSAFRNCSRLTSITIPDGVTSISQNTFYSCSGLTSITIPDSVTSIGNYAFYYSNALSDVYYSGTLADFTKIKVGSYNTSFTSAKVHCKDHSIDTSGSYGSCGDNVIYVLDDTGKLTIFGEGDMTSYNLASAAPWYGDRTKITSVVIENGVTSIADYAFTNYSRLRSITIPDSVTSIGQYILYGCTGITNVTIPDSVKSIGRFAFGECTSLTEITIPDGVETITEYTFYGCSALRSITIPDSIKSIGDYAFIECDALSDVYYSGTLADFSEIQIGKYNTSFTNAVVHCN